MSHAQGSSCPSTPTTTEAVIHHVASPQAPKKPKETILEYLQPTVYKPEADDMLKAPKTILDALTRAIIRKPTTKPKGESTDVKYSTPRKLTVSVVDGKTDRIIHKYVPTRLLMGISARAAEILEAKPWASEFEIHGRYEPAAMNSVIYAIILSQKMPVSADLTANLVKYEACLRLGIPSTHSSVKPLLTAINTQISTTTITPEVLTFITYHLGSQDPVFTHMANVLCHQRFKGAVGNVEACGKMVAKKPALQKAMVQIDQAHKARREAINDSKRNQTKKSEDESGAESLNKLLVLPKSETIAREAGNIVESREELKSEKTEKKMG